MKKRISTLAVLAAVIMLGAMIGCGGGGGGSESVNYTGETMAAVIGTDSAVDLALEATVGSVGEYDELPLPPGLIGGTSLGLASDPLAVIDLARRVLGAGPSAQPLDVSAEPLAKVCDSGRENGLDGYVQGEICFDTNNEDWIKIDMTFVEYSNGSFQMDGRIILEGTETDNTVIFRDLVTLAAGVDIYADGWVDYVEDPSAQDVTISYNLTVIDSEYAKAFWLDDYVIVANWDTDEVTISGNFYDYDDGYVTVTTETALSWDLTMDPTEGLIWADHPTAGTVKLTGADGYWISITFNSIGYYVNINYTGDDASDITVPTIGEIPWI